MLRIINAVVFFGPEHLLCRDVGSIRVTMPSLISTVFDIRSIRLLEVIVIVTITYELNIRNL